MFFNHFLEKVNQLKTIPLGGEKAHFKLAPALRLRYNEDKIKASNPRKAAVLVLFYPDDANNTSFLLTKRAAYKGVHSNQISFPGGKKDVKDTSLEHTALRETFEEVGITQKSIRIIREISDVYIPPSNFLTTPFIGCLESKPIFRPNYEVAQTISVLLSDLLDEKNIGSVNMNTSYMKNVEVPCFNLDDNIVWGATGMILSEIRELLKQISF